MSTVDRAPASGSLASNLIVWMDLEMTGLDPLREQILELAILVTDGELRVVAEGPQLVLHQPASVLAAMDSWNQEHHGASGLVDRVRASDVTVAAAEAQLLEFLTPLCAPRVAPLAGNSIHQDRSFLRIHMPRFEAHLHYRNIDVSTIKEVARRWFPQELSQAPPKAETHRALDDIRASIAELEYYRRSIFR
ncbi:MAG: oligoribonuclease [Planctomycetota bacterium]